MQTIRPHRMRILEVWPVFTVRFHYSWLKQFCWYVLLTFKNRKRNFHYLVCVWELSSLSVYLFFAYWIYIYVFVVHFPDEISWPSFASPALYVGRFLVRSIRFVAATSKNKVFASLQGARTYNEPKTAVKPPLYRVCVVSQHQDLVEQLFGEIETHLLLLMCGSVYCIAVYLWVC